MNTGQDHPDRLTVSGILYNRGRDTVPVQLVLLSVGRSSNPSSYVDRTPEQAH